MNTENSVNFFLITGVCFVLLFFSPGEIPAQTNKPDKNPPQDRQLVRPKQTDTKQPKSTKSNAKTDSTPRKKIIVVLDFDNVSIGNCRDDVYGRNIATQLSTAFSETGEYTVVEKQRIEDVFKSIETSQDERYDPRTAAKVGKALSSNSVVLGTITECNATPKRFGIPGARYITVTLKVGLVIRIVDINTGEILDAVKTTQTAQDKGGSFGGFGKESEMTSEVIIELFNQAVEKAVKESVVKLTSIIEGKISPDVAREKIPTGGNTAKKNLTNVSAPSKPRISSFPKVATVVGTTVYITGLGQDVKVGDLLSVIRGVEIKNPDTGEVIDFDGNEIAKVEVIEVRENTIKAKIIQGKGIREKDVVKPIQ